MTKKLLVAALALSAAVYSLDAKVTLHHLIGDNMVLQQQTEARLYGYDEPGKTVKVTPSWDGKKYTGTLTKVEAPQFTILTQEKQKQEGKKRPVLVDVEKTFSMDEVKYCKYVIDFK